MGKKVVVLMSTYNGEKYIEEQISSILSQRDVQVELAIRDDGSTDSTCKIIEGIAAKTDKIRFMEGENIGCEPSFLKLLYESNGLYGNADYYAFSDQDDIWDLDKLSSGVKRMELLDAPAFYYSAQRIVDKNGNFIRDELCFDKVQKYSKWAASTVTLARGCTQMWNKKMHEILMACKPDIRGISHDSWCMLVAFFRGQIVYDEVPHMGYRQTGSNLIGAYQSRLSKVWYIGEKIKRRFMKSPNMHERKAKQLEAVCPGVYLLTAHYRDGWKQKMQMLFAKEYREGLALRWRVFNAVLILCNRL